MTTEKFLYSIFLTVTGLVSVGFILNAVVVIFITTGELLTDYIKGKRRGMTMTNKEAVECAEKLKRFCAERFDHGRCKDDLYKDCPFYNGSTRIKCLIAPKNADPFEWETNRIVDDENI